MTEKNRMRSETVDEHASWCARREAKYIIPLALVYELREFLRPFCAPDPHGVGEPPEYTVTTLQLDTPDWALHRAKEREATNRFKLRVRTYGTPGSHPVFAEVKRKFGETVVKTRSTLPHDLWGVDLLAAGADMPPFRSQAEAADFFQFIDLARGIGARPAIVVRYTREAYVSRHPPRARVSFDRQLLYQPAPTWDRRSGNGRWLSMDSTLAQNAALPFSGVVLELKCTPDVPVWMIELVRQFQLCQTGHCKYSAAVWSEALFSGAPTVPPYAAGLLRW